MLHPFGIYVFLKHIWGVSRELQENQTGQLSGFGLCKSRNEIKSLGWGPGAGQGAMSSSKPARLGAGRVPLIFPTGENSSGRHPLDEYEMTLFSLLLPELPGGCNTLPQKHVRAVTPGNGNTYTVCTPTALSQSLYILQSLAMSQIKQI